MPIAPDTTRDYLRTLAGNLDTAGHGGKGALLEDAQALFGWSRSKLYAELERQAGWSSGRRVRADKGATRAPESALSFVASMERGSIRLNGKQTMHTPLASSIAIHNGHDPLVSASQVNRLMRVRRIGARQQAEASAPITLRYLHPNHVHQVDPSLCLVYYLRGEQHLIREDQFYKNKLEGLAKVQFKVWRYTLADPCSGYALPWYVESAGENPKNLFHFLMHAWGQQDGRRFHGVPFILGWDKGSANTSSPIVNLLEALEVEAITHAAGNARAKGSVENANNLVETQFECRLRFDPVADVAALNAAAASWAEAWNANAIPGQDTRLRRKGMEPVARYDLWMRIREEQLRLLPPVEVCQAFLEGRSETRKVSKKLEISYRHPQAGRPRSYDVAGLAGVCAGDTLAISPLLFGECAISITAPNYKGEDLRYRLEPLPEAWDDFGFPLSAPVFGQDYARRPDSDADRAAKALDQILYPDQDAKRARDKNVTPMGGTVDAVRHLAHIDLPAMLPRRGTDINVQGPQFEPEKLTTSAAVHRLQSQGVKTAGLYDWLRQSYPEGIPEDELPRLVERLRGVEQAGLRAVGGGA